ncbi:MAG: GIY-YIG nuclease family protein [Candidatus Symbiobacter sp.]|nr:GIY-YIG nuclease family protein [Candidatus Symbiobacter sp.]
MEKNQNLEIVYVLTNPAMPELVKIGRTSRSDLRKRINDLNSTSVPFPFKIEFSCNVEDSRSVESALFTAFAPQRVNPKREFFKIIPEQAIAILKLLHVEESTEELTAIADESIDEDEKQAVEKFILRRPALDFALMEIPVGSKLRFKTDAAIECEVYDARKVVYNGEVSSLTKLTTQLLNREYAVQPTPYWTYNGKNLLDIYNETFTTEV